MNVPPAARLPAARMAVARMRWRLVLGVLTGVLAAALAPTGLGALARTLVGWLGFAAVDGALILLGMWQADADDIRRVAATEDLPRALASALVLGAALASLGAVGGLLGSLRSLPPGLRPAYFVLGVGAVLLAWLLVHLVFTLRYAHAYYDADAAGQDQGGLLFPDSDKNLEPNYLDFAYFAFVLGMTAQTADVAIGSRRLRGIALLHGLISFVFNTVIVALTIGTIGSMLS